MRIPTNLVALMRVLRGDLRGLDLSRLALRGVSLQGVEMQDARLSEAALQDSVFTEPFDAIMAVAMSPSGQYWTAGSRRGEVWVWAEAGRTLHLVWQAHSANVYALAFSSDGRTLASASHDGSVKLWDVASGTLLWTGWHTGGIICVTFAPDECLLATG
jgi:WD40 repeat protein